MKASVLPAIIALLLVSSACSSVENARCARADECNVLVGVSVDECTEQLSQIIDGVTSDEAADWRKKSSDCLDFQTCGNYLTCAAGADLGTAVSSRFSSIGAREKAE